MYVGFGSVSGSGAKRYQVLRVRFLVNLVADWHGSRRSADDKKDGTISSTHPRPRVRVGAPEVFERFEFVACAAAHVMAFWRFDDSDRSNTLQMQGTASRTRNETSRCTAHAQARGEGVQLLLKPLFG
jgi:hypothetical protein